MKFYSQVFLFVFLSSFNAIVLAEVDEKPAFAGSLLMERCVIGKAQEITARNDHSLVRLSAEHSKLFLKNRSGKAWMAAVPFGEFVLTIHDDGLCSVHIRRINSDAIKKEFLWIINYMARGTGKVEEIGRNQIKQDYGVLQQYSYRVSDTKFGTYNAVLTTSDSNAAPLQALMTISPAQ